MVTQPHLVVLPVPEEGGTKEEEDPEKPHKHRRRRWRKPKRIGPFQVERKAVVASAVLVLGVAMAIYGLQSSAPERHHGGATRELKRLSRFMGGLVVGAGQQLWDGVVGMAG